MIMKRRHLIDLINDVRRVAVIYCHCLRGQVIAVGDIPDEDYPACDRCSNTGFLMKNKNIGVVYPVTPKESHGPPTLQVCPVCRTKFTGRSEGECPLAKFH